MTVERWAENVASVLMRGNKVGQKAELLVNSEGGPENLYLSSTRAFISVTLAHKPIYYHFSLTVVVWAIIPALNVLKNELQRSGNKATWLQ